MIAGVRKPSSLSPTEFTRRLSLCRYPMFSNIVRCGFIVRPIIVKCNRDSNPQGDLKMSVAESAKKVYDEDLRSRLEQDHKDDFVAIEPLSRRFFLGKTFLEVALAAKEAFPDKKSFVIRIGHEAAFHIGEFSQ